MRARRSQIPSTPYYPVLRTKHPVIRRGAQVGRAKRRDLPLTCIPAALPADRLGHGDGGRVTARAL